MSSGNSNPILRRLGVEGNGTGGHFREGLRGTEAPGRTAEPGVRRDHLRSTLPNDLLTMMDNPDWAVIRQTHKGDIKGAYIPHHGREFVNYFFFWRV